MTIYREYRYKTLLLIATMSALLIGCGSDDSEQTSVDNMPVSTKIELNEFYINISDSNDSSFSRSQRAGSQSKQTGIRSYRSGNNTISFQSGGLFNDIDVEKIAAYGNNFISKQYLADIKSVGTTLIFDVKYPATNAVERYSINYTTFDLSGYTLAQGKQAIANNKGITTDLNKLNALPETTAFPTGSLCFVETYESASIPLFIDFVRSFGPDDYKTLDEWETGVVATNGNYQSAISSKVGPNNTIDARRLTYANSNNKATTISAIRPNTAVEGFEVPEGLYSVRYVPTEKQYFANKTDATNELVKCANVNDIAADFLEAQIVKYY